MVQPQDLLRRIRAEPFQAFEVVLKDHTRIDVSVPRMLVSDQRAFIVTKWRKSPRGSPIAVDWRDVSLEFIAEIIDRKASSRRRAVSSAGGKGHVA